MFIALVVLDFFLEPDTIVFTKAEVGCIIIHMIVVHELSKGSV